MTRKEDPTSVRFRCLRLRQPIGEFFVGVMSYQDLCAIADFDVRRVIDEERDVERYLGIQRPLHHGRVRDLESYVNTFDATFPTSIILAVPGVCTSYNEAAGEITLSNYPAEKEEDGILFRNIARVLDGQHRIAGLYKFHGANFDLSVTIFVEIDLADQAQIFSTVNLEQTKVNRSLAYDLFSLAKSRSPQKTAHNIAVALDQDRDSPFYRRIKRLGVATPGRDFETITQAQFVEAVLRLISKDPKLDRDLMLRGKSLPRPNDEELNRRPLRGLFVAEEDVTIAKIIFNYFAAIRDRWPAAWGSTEKGLILNKTNGFRGLMRFFRAGYLSLTLPGSVASQEQFLRLFERVHLTDGEFNTDRFPPGSSGEAELFQTLMRHTELPSP